MHGTHISNIEIAERYSRSRVSPAWRPCGKRVWRWKNNTTTTRTPFASIGDPFCTLSYLSSLFISPVFCLLSFFSLSRFLFRLLIPFSPPSGENSSACLYVVWSRATRVQYKTGMHCESDSPDNPTTSTTWQRLCTMISKLNWLYFGGCFLRNIED